MASLIIGQSPYGSTTFAQSVDQINLGLYSFSGLSVRITELRIKCSAASATTKLKAVIYACDGSDNPTTLLGTSNELTGVVIGENTLTFGTPVVLAQGRYYIGYHIGIAGMSVYNSTSTGTNRYQTRSYASGVPNPFGAATVQTGQRAVQAWGETLNAYPLNLAPTNPGGETGTVAGWTGTIGVTAAVKRSGSYSLGGATAAAIDAYQDLAIPAGYNADVDTGLLQVLNDVYQYGADPGYPEIQLLDGSDNLIRRYTQTPEAPGAVWYPRQMQYSLVPGTRKIRTRIQATRSAGSGDCLSYWDDLVTQLTYNPSFAAREVILGSLMKRATMRRQEARNLTETRLLKNTMKRGRSYFTIQVIEVDSGGESHFNNGFN